MSSSSLKEASQDTGGAAKGGKMDWERPVISLPGYFWRTYRRSFADPFEPGNTTFCARENRRTSAQLVPTWARAAAVVRVLSGSGMPPAPGSVACPALTIYTMRVQASTSTLLSLVVTLLVGSVYASTDTSNRVRSSIAESEEFERNREQIEQDWKEEERRIKAGEELPAEVDLDAASAAELRGR
jgi:hypothetical protein